MNTNLEIRNLNDKINGLGRTLYRLKKELNSSGNEIETITYTNGIGLTLTENAFNVVYGTTVNTSAQGNDSRFHTHSNKAILDATTSSFTTALKTKLDGLNNYVLTKDEIINTLGYTPIATTHACNSITTTNITNWNTSFGWGNHASAGYVKQVKTINNVTLVGTGNIELPTTTEFNTLKDDINNQVESLGQNVLYLMTADGLITILEQSSEEEISKLKTLLGI